MIELIEKINGISSMFDFPDWLQKEMDKRGISQKELANLGEISPPQVSKILNRQSPAGPEAALGIARALKLDPVTVFRMAGLLPPGTEAETDQRENGLIHMFRQMDEMDKDDIYAYVEWKYISAEKRRNQIKDLRTRLESIPPEKSDEAFEIVNGWLAEIGARRVR